MHANPDDLKRLAGAALALAWQAADEIMRIRSDFLARHGVDVRQKGDGSPVTAADEAAEAIILQGLRVLTPDLPIVSEEAAAKGYLPSIAAGTFWIVDPLDGTREFAKGGEDFTVNIALVTNGLPLIGVVLAPATGTAWFSEGAQSAWRSTAPGERPSPIAVRAMPPEGATVLVSRSHMDAQTEAWLADAVVHAPIAHRTDIGSSLKFCSIAEGKADLYPRFGRTMEWDTAAGQAVLMAAGGSVVCPDGSPFRYGKPGFVNTPFIARSGR